MKFVSMITAILFISNLIFSEMVLFDFKHECDLNNWTVVDDVVMGGRSDGQFGISAEGHGEFHGEVSLENNGGFSSVRYNFDEVEIEGFTEVHLRIKGDGKAYQFRVKSNASDRNSYVYLFETSSDWETIIIPLSELAPRFRGRNLDMPNYSSEQIAELAFLISNKRA